MPWLPATDLGSFPGSPAGVVLLGCMRADLRGAGLHDDGEVHRRSMLGASPQLADRPSEELR